MSVIERSEDGGQPGQRACSGSRPANWTRAPTSSRRRAQPSACAAPCSTSACGALSRSVTLVEGQALVCPRRPGVTFEQQARNCARAARRPRRTALRMHRPQERRSNRAGQKGRRREPGEPDLDAGQFRLALRRRFLALLRQQLRVRGPERRLRIGRTLRTITTAQEPLAAG